MGLSGTTVTVTDCFRFSGTNKSKECLHISKIERICEEIAFTWRFLCFFEHILKNHFMCILPALCVCTTCVLGACVGQKGTVNSLELELQMAVNQHVSVRNQT